MKITAVNVVLQFVVTESTENERLALDSFAEARHEELDEPVYEATNQIVKAVLANAKKLNIPMKDRKTPVHDFSIGVHFRVDEPKK